MQQPFLDQRCLLLDFNIQGTVVQNCNISNVSTLDFGTVFQTLSQNVDNTATITALCNGNMNNANTYTYVITLGYGNQPDGQQRRMVGPNGGMLNYGLYRDAARTQAWGNTPQTGYQGTGNGQPQNLTVYGRVPAQPVPGAGVYTDTVVVNPLRRKLLVSGCTLLTLPVIPSLAHAATILAVRTWPAEEYTRVTLEMDTELKAEHFTVENPNRLVVDIDGLSMSRAIDDLVSKIKPNDPYIRSVRVGQNRPNVVRLVFDLKQAVAPQVFTLKPIGQYKYRLVLDLYPKVAQDPLMALLKDSQNDPLAGVLEDLARNNPDEAAIPSVKGQQLPPMARENPSEPQVPPLGGRQNRPILVAIDPGHGGEDPGATGMRGTHRKRYRAGIAFRLKKLIDSQPNMRAYMTRDRDYFVPLHVRVQKARRVKADLFVSIHADAFINRTARGSSVWALSQHGASSSAARWLANGKTTRT
ncbi:hypothetical protein CDEF62S_03258 [Castellaniella defragrans]